MTRTAVEPQQNRRVAYSLTEAAASMGKTTNAVFQQVRADRIPTVRIGKRHFIPAEYLTHGSDRPQGDA